MTLSFAGMRPRRLLIVGDPALSRGLMKMVLSRLGYVVTCVVSAQDAQMTLSHSQFALALVALHLPDLPGLTLARRLRHSLPPTGAMPIIMFGDAWDPERVLTSCRESRLDGYLPKPISIARLVSSIHDQIHRLPSEAGEPLPMPAAPPLELDRLASFTGDDPQLERELTALYLATAAGYLNEMRVALTAGAAWTGPAHALKGASANVGAGAVARLAAAAEHAPASMERLAQLERAVAQVREFVRAREHDLARPRPPRAAVG